MIPDCANIGDIMYNQHNEAINIPHAASIKYEGYMNRLALIIYNYPAGQGTLVDSTLTKYQSISNSLLKQRAIEKYGQSGFDSKVQAFSDRLLNGPAAKTRSEYEDFAVGECLYRVKYG